MSKLLVAALITLSTSTMSEDVGWGTNDKVEAYEYECFYQTPFQDFPEEEIVVRIKGKIEHLSELKDKHEIVVGSDGENKTLKVSNCKAES